MADYKSYLAASILTEDKIVTYGLLSRVLKVHVNAAKEMLFEFHRVQNGKKPGTIHATYLVSGTKRKGVAVPTNGHTKDGDDEYMQSSPFMSSSMPQPQESTGESSVLSISLTREEDLDKVRSKYESISSIHIYSLGPHTLKNLQMLSDSTREIQDLCSPEDPLEFYPKYGIITNPNVKRRTRRAPPPAPAPMAIPTKPVTARSKLNEVQEAPQSTSQSSSKPEPKSQPSNAKDFFGNKGKEKPKAKPKTESSAPSSKEAIPAPPANMKRESSSLFKAFAKTQPKKQKVESEAESPKEDTLMKDVSSDDDEEVYEPPVPSRKKEDGDKDRKSRKEREEALRKMMEEDDDEPSSAPPPVEDEVVEEKEEPVKEEPVKEEEPSVTVTDGKRRGKRRVMKKKTVKDEEGFLVTKQEQAWESFSEDEPAPPPKPKIQVASSTKPKKGAAAKTGQGNIMSFFGKPKAK